MRVGVIGYSGPVDLPPVSDLKDVCIELGHELGKSGYIVFNGGRDGVMELVSKGVKEVGGITVGILPAESYANDYLSFAIYTGLDFQMRSFVMLKNVDLVVSIGGEIGTAIEILGAYAYGVPVILLRGTGGWADRFSQVLIDGRYLDNRRKVEVYQAWSVEEVLKIIRKIKGE